jgi:Bacterial PH domain
MAEGQKGPNKFFDIGADASKYLVEGEAIHWQGKPATIVIVGRGVLLVILALIFTISLWLGQMDVVSITVAFISCILMMITDRRYGLIVGVASIIIIPLVYLFSTSGAMALVTLVPLIYSLIYLLVHIIYLTRVLFVITDQRIITRYGIFSLRYAELDLDRIQNVTVIQPWYERFLGYGDVYYATAGEQGGIDYQRPGIKLMGGGEVTWEDVGNPFGVVKKVNEIIHSVESIQREKGEVHPQVVNDAEERLEQLSELNAKGLISQQEYRQKRDEILKEL